MPMDLVTLGLDKLSVQERLELIETLWDSLPDEVDVKEIPDWHLLELAKRRVEASHHSGIGKPWREVLDSLEITP